MKLVLDFDELAALHLMGCIDALTFNLSQGLPEERLQVLQQISEGIRNNRDITLFVQSESFTNRAEFATNVAKTITLFVRDQNSDIVDFQKLVLIGTVEEKKT